MARKYTHIKQYEKGILAMKKAGKTREEIAREFNLTKEQVKGFLKRRRQEEREREAVRPRKADAKKTNHELRSELKHLRIETELLQDFTQAVERK